MRTAVAVAVLCLSLSAQTKKFDYRGAIPGVTTVEQCSSLVADAFHKDQAEWSANHPGTSYPYYFSDVKLSCSDYSEHAKFCFSLATHYYFLDNILAYVELEQNVSGAEAYRNALIAKFGAPNSTEQIERQNAFGAKWRSNEFFWVTPDGRNTVSFSERGRKIDTFVLTVADTELQKKYLASVAPKPKI